MEEVIREGSKKSKKSFFIILGLAILGLVALGFGATKLPNWIESKKEVVAKHGVVAEEIATESPGEDIDREVADKLDAALIEIENMKKALSLDYDHSVRNNGQSITTDWLVKYHPIFGEIAFPAIRDERGRPLLFRGDDPPYVACLPECWVNNIRWCHVWLGEENENGEFHYYQGLERIYRSGAKRAWVLVRDQDWDKINPVFMARVVVVQKKTDNGS